MDSGALRRSLARHAAYGASRPASVEMPMTPLSTILRRMADNPETHPLVRAAIAEGLREADEGEALKAVTGTMIDGIARNKIEGGRRD